MCYLDWNISPDNAVIKNKRTLHLYVNTTTNFQQKSNLNHWKIMDRMSDKPADSQINYKEDISKLEEILLSDKANIEKMEVENAEEKEKIVV